MSQTDDRSGGDAIWCVKNGDINGLKDQLKKVRFFNHFNDEKSFNFILESKNRQ